MGTEKIIATTHVDRHFQRIPREELERMAAGLGQEATRSTIEHDVLIPPVGKGTDPKVIPLPDGEHGLMITDEPLEPVEEFTLPDGSPAIRLATPNDRTPFVYMHEFGADGFAVSIDLQNFESDAALRALDDDLRRIADFQLGFLGRKSLVPDPQIFIQLPEWLANLPLKDLLLLYPAVKVGKQAVDKASDQISDQVAADLVRLYTFLRAAPVALLRHAIPRSRPATCLYFVSGHPRVEFAVRADQPETFAEAVDLPRMLELVTEAQAYRQNLGAREVQYLYTPENGWKLNYFLTDAGEVVGTKAALERQHQQIELLFARQSDGAFPQENGNTSK